jgi:hypothetical protein
VNLCVNLCGTVIDLQIGGRKLEGLILRGRVDDWCTGGRFYVDLSGGCEKRVGRWSIEREVKIF